MMKTQIQRHVSCVMVSVVLFLAGPLQDPTSGIEVLNLAGFIPAAPTVNSPANGETIKSNLAFIKWTGDSHTQYQVRICTVNNPEAGITWDSKEVSSSRDWAWTGALANLTNYYVYVKIGTSSGWSAAGRWFRVDSSYNDLNNVKVYGNSLKDANGPFLGLGFTYMRSLQRCKYDRNRWHSDIAAMSGKGFNYQRILSMVGWWIGLEIAPIAFTNSQGTPIPAWSDYWSQFDYDIDTAYNQYGIRTEVIIFADAQYCMPNSSNRYTHMDNILAHCNARAHKIVQIEVANEAWQNGFSDVATVRSFGQYLADRTSIPVSLSSWDTSDAGIQTMNAGSAADIATVHFSRDTGTIEGGWLPVRDCWRVAFLYPGVPPVSSNEPIGSGSSVSSEDDPIKLSSAATFAWIANLPMYVYHSRAGTSAIDGGGNPVPFENTAGFSAYQYLRQILPPDLASWIRNDGIESAAPFTVFCSGQADKYWTDVSGATSGCHRNIGGIKGNQFVCCPQGILSGGVTLQARRDMNFTVYNPLTGAVVDTRLLDASQSFTLPQGPRAYIIKGTFPEQPLPLVIVHVTPDPDTVFIGDEYIKQLTINQGYPAPSWSVIQGPPGLLFDPNTGYISLVQGWIPTGSDCGNLFAIVIQASNSAGSDTDTWQVEVKFLADFDDDCDIDQEDFGLFQVCLSGSGYIYEPGCEDADFDGDGDVDWSDTNYFLANMTGPRVPSPPEGMLGDFDEDGDVDSQDLKEFSKQWLCQSSVTADLRPDGIVNLLDFAEFSRYWGTNSSGQ